MSVFSVVCIDMFQTLVDVNSRRYAFWQAALNENYSDRLADEYTEIWLLVFTKYFNELQNHGPGFRRFRSIAETCFEAVFKQIGCSLDPKRAAHLWIKEHRLAPPYEDTDLFIESVGADFPLCLVSDADDDMIFPHLENYRFDAVFTSERFKSYKSNSEGKLFDAVISHYSINPGKIIHIGDSISDIAGAKRAGIATCWLNRDRLTWNYDIRPDYEAKSLIEAASILGIRPCSVS